jgi:hypothetical protein
MRSQETHAAAQGSRSTRKDLNMKTKIWVLCTVLADENAPAMPAVFVDKAEAWAKYDEVIRYVLSLYRGVGIFAHDRDRARFLHRDEKSHDPNAGL